MFHTTNAAITCLVVALSCPGLSADADEEGAAWGAPDSSSRLPSWIDAAIQQGEMDPADQAAIARPIVARIPELIEIAHQAGSGALGCGFGGRIDVVRDGTETVVCECSLDVRHVFGREVSADDLDAILRVRTLCTSTGKGLFSSPDDGYLAMLALELTRQLHDVRSIDTAVAMLHDPHPSARYQAATVILDVGHRFEDLRPLAASIHIDPRVIANHERVTGCDFGWSTPAW